MKKRTYLLTFLVMLGMLLTACSGDAAPETVVDEPAEPVATEEAVEEPVEVATEEPAVVETEEPIALARGEAVEANFQTMLETMAGYNTIRADDLLLELLEDEPPFLLDVRTTGELEENGHITGATHIQLAELAQFPELLPSLDTPIVTYCGSGWRATIAMTMLKGMGYEDVRALKTTFADWSDGGNPVTEGVPEAFELNAVTFDEAVVADVNEALAVYGVKPYAGISADDFNLALGENADLVVIDVRRQEELDGKGYIEAANWIHIPLEQFVAEKAQWPAADADIVVYCGSGHRSTMATAILGANGYANVLSLKGGFGGWVGAGFPYAGGQPAESATNANFQAMLETMAGYNTVRADGLLVELLEDEPPFLLDVRTLGELEEKGHISGATHIQLDQLGQNVELLPSFDTPIVTYCGSGWRATIAMTMLKGMGYEDVRALKTTFADWVDGGNPVTEGVPEVFELNAVEVDENILKDVGAALSVYGVKPYAGISADDFNLALGENADLVVIDVRRQEELDGKGYIEAANWIHIPLEQFVAEKAQWPAADADIVVYCGSGHRSTMATAILGANGYENVLSLKGGFGGWVGAGYPFAGGASSGAAAEANFQTMLETMEGYNTVRADDLMLEMLDDEPPFLLDVRTLGELEENGHISGATHIQLDQLGQFVELLPSFDTPIVTYCGSGWRATIAMTMLKGMGYEDVRALKTTFADWVDAGNPVTEGVPELFELNAVEVDANILKEVGTALEVYGVRPYGVITADDFNLALLDNPDLVVIDVRRDEELAEKGVIEAANWIHIPLEQFVAEKAQWPAADANVVVYCGSGHRSTMATAILGANGYGSVSSLKGGFGGWVTDGYPAVEYTAP